MKKLQASASQPPLLRTYLHKFARRGPPGGYIWHIGGQDRKLASQPHSSGEKRLRPLEGVTVVSIEQAIAGPLCTRHLADRGARVIKIERTGVGDFARHYDTRVNGLSSHFVWVNRSKESLALDLKSSVDLSILKKLLGRADVLVQNLAPGAAARMGLTYEALHEQNPSIIVCNISGYGPDGPYTHKKAYDLLVQAEAGVLAVTGTPEAPAKVGVSIADISTGMYAYSNILAALMQRWKDGGEKGKGKGCKIEVSMLESMVEWNSFPIYYTYDDAPAPVRAGAAHATIFPYGPFQTGDGTSVVFGIQNEREWTNLCAKVLANAALATDERFSSNAKRLENRNILRGIIEKAFSDKTDAMVVALLDEAAIANAKVNDMRAVWRHPQLQARNRWTEVSTPVGPIPALIPPGDPANGVGEGGNARMDRVPALGEHTESILTELGIKREV